MQRCGRCRVAVRLGPTEVALRPRSPSSQPGASRIEWKFDFSCREWMDCLVECEQLGSAGSLWCNMFSGGQQTQARERVLKRTLHSNTRDTLEGGYTFFYSGSGPKSTLLATKPKRVGPGVVSLRHVRGGVIFLLPSPGRARPSPRPGTWSTWSAVILASHPGPGSGEAHPAGRLSCLERQLGSVLTSTCNTFWPSPF